MDDIRPASDPQGELVRRPLLLTLLLGWGRSITAFVVGPDAYLQDQLLGQLRYIGPLRGRPPRDFTPPREPDPRRWTNGLAVWELLWGGGGCQLNSLSLA